MGLKEYFLNTEDADKKTPANPETIKFPDATPATAAPVVSPIIGTTNCEPHMEAIMSLYEKGFDGLNQPGVEFFEFFKSVIAGGVDNPATYTMAFNMLKGLESGMNKQSLLSQSNFYKDEILKVYQGYIKSGTDKKMEIEKQRDAETERLRSDLDLLRQQLETIKTQIQTKDIQLTQQDAKYNPAIEEIGCKMAANEVAKEKIIGTINKVVAGITNNL